MVFKVERTSRYDEKPCPRAKRGTIESWDHRTSKSFEEFDAKVAHFRGQGAWLSKGTDHQVVYGPRGGVQGIKRRMEDRDAWFIELESLEDLMDFFEYHGELVIKTAWEDRKTPTIEIYDNYRE